MAVDTRSKRASVLGFTLASLVALPLPDGTVDAVDRVHLAYSYSGITLGVVSGSGDVELNALTLAAAGAYGPTGSGDVALNAMTLAGAGAYGPTGASAVELNEFTLSGSGTVGVPVTGTGAVEINGLTVAGVGALEVTGTGNVNLNLFRVDGTGIGGEDVAGATGGWETRKKPKKKRDIYAGEDEAREASRRERRVELGLEPRAEPEGPSEPQEAPQAPQAVQEAKAPVTPSPGRPTLTLSYEPALGPEERAKLLDALESGFAAEDDEAGQRRRRLAALLIMLAA